MIRALPRAHAAILAAAIFAIVLGAAGVLAASHQPAASRDRGEAGPLSAGKFPRRGRCRPYRRRARRDERARDSRIRVQSSARATVKQTLADAGFGETVLLITATAPWADCSNARRAPTRMHADLFIAIHHDSGAGQSAARPGNTTARNSITTTTILAMPFSSPTITPIAPAACCSAAFSARSCKRAACNTRRITRCR